MGAQSDAGSIRGRGALPRESRKSCGRPGISERKRGAISRAGNLLALSGLLAHLYSGSNSEQGQEQRPGDAISGVVVGKRAAWAQNAFALFSSLVRYGTVRYGTARGTGWSGMGGLAMSGRAPVCKETQGSVCPGRGLGGGGEKQTTTVTGRNRLQCGHLQATTSGTARSKEHRCKEGKRG
jgi:hypothetical protein